MPKSFDKQFVSMSPLLLPGDKPLIKRSSRFKINDIVVFERVGKLIAHRLVYISPDKRYFVTRGDNNLKADGKIHLDQILGKVDKIERERQKIRLDHVYLSQSVNYIRQLGKINEEFNKKNLSYTLLKGLPLHIHFSGSPPKRLYLDADLLIRKEDLRKATATLKRLGFEKVPIALFSKKTQVGSQLSFYKNTKPFEVVIDLHLEPAIAFTKLKEINKLLPRTNEFTKHLFKSIQKIKIEKNYFPILKKETLVLYLLLHFYHHNFNGAHRLELINTIIKGVKIDWNKLERLTKKFEFENLIYPGILMLQRYYNTKIPNKFLNKIAPPFFPKIIGVAISKLITPFNTSTRTVEGIKRFLVLIFLSPTPRTLKLKAIFQKETVSYFWPSIKSLLFSSETKTSKSFLA